jgi:hypothetical protein
MRPDLLHVVVPYSNPLRWNSRLNLFQQFAKHMQESGVCLHVVECAYGNRPFVLRDECEYHHIGVRARDMVWNKENLLNIGIARLPEDWRYMAWIDADVFFRSPTWAQDTVHLLQQFAVIQPWSDCYDLGPEGEHLHNHKSFCRQFFHGLPVGKGPYEFAHPGYAWACTREALDKLGGFIETGALGAGDKHMALALLGRADESIPEDMTAGYRAPIKAWERNAEALKRNIGYLKGTIEHAFHGPKPKRNYLERWKVLAKHKFDPVWDLRRNTWGVYDLAGNKPDLRRDMAKYFMQRFEDANTNLA